MCVVVYKPKGKKMPKEQTLLDCFLANPDGAGYMFQKDNKVKIKKGFMTFKSFYKSLMDDYSVVGKNTDFVLHFRISTQGGVNEKLCHPYPISKKMDDLKQTECESELGLAHNGIISLTTEHNDYGYGKWSQYGYKYDYNDSYFKVPDYNDTMKFITKYLSLIMKDAVDVFDEDKVSIVKKLIGSYNKFAIMTGDGVNLIGNFTDINGIHYSNTHFIGRSNSYTNSIKFDVIENNDGDLVEYADDGKQDYSDKLGCGYANCCKNCTRFMECYGFELPEEWECLEDEEIDYLISYYVYGIGDAVMVERIENKAELNYWE